MSATPPLAVPQTLALDRLFCRLAEQASGRPLPLEEDEASFDAAGETDGAEFAETQPPPPIENAADLRAAHEWLLRERQRLGTYTRGQLAQIQKEHQAFVQQAYLKEQGLILRTQEFNRKEELLQHQFGVLRQRAEALAEKERKLAPYLHPLWDGQAELAELGRVNSALSQEANEQRALVERLRSEAATLEQDREASRAELAARSSALHQEREALEARQAQMNQRLRGLEDAEAAARRRTRDLDEMEARLRREFQEQEKQLAQLRRVSESLLQDTKGQRVLLDRLRAEAQTRAKERDAARTAERRQKEVLAAGQAQLNQRLLALESAEAAVRRRAAELDELEVRLCRDFEERERRLHSTRRESEAADSYCVQP